MKKKMHKLKLYSINIETSYSDEGLIQNLNGVKWLEILVVISFDLTRWTARTQIINLFILIYISNFKYTYIIKCDFKCIYIL